MKKNILILFGGESGEYDVSCISAGSVLANINKDKYNIIKIGITRRGEWFMTDASPDEISKGAWEALPKKKALVSPDKSHRGIVVIENHAARVIPVDAVFPVMHGTHCEDGCLQGLFELSGIPFVGSGVLSSAVCMDKGVAKLVFDEVGIPQVKWLLIEKSELEYAPQKVEEVFSYPVFVKPSGAGSSLGASSASDRVGLVRALENAAEHDNRILVEEFVPAREIECSVLGNQNPATSVLGEIIPSNEFYDYNAKYIDNASVLKIPAPLDNETTEKIREYAALAYRAAGCKGLARVDFFIHKTYGEIYLNEINTIPGFTSISMYPKLWEASGLPYSKLIDTLLELACEN